MSITQVSTSQTATTSRADQMKQAKADFTALSQALSSGDLAGAQKAFSALQADRPKGGHGHHRQGGDATAPTAGSTSTAPKTDPFAAIGQALQSGDLQAAQKAFAAIQTAMKSRQSSASSGSDSDGDNDGSKFNSSGGTFQIQA